MLKTALDDKDDSWFRSHPKFDDDPEKLLPLTAADRRRVLATA
jgi:hypothetical protein